MDLYAEVLDLCWPLLVYLLVGIFVSSCLIVFYKAGLHRHLLIGNDCCRVRTKLMMMISPFDFLTFRNCIRKYQNLDLAAAIFDANILMR